MSDESPTRDTRDDVPITDESRWILWDPRDGEPRFDEAGECVFAGALGPVGRDNVYLTTYACYLSPDGYRQPRHTDLLRLGERTRARFSLSGSTGVYEVIRVR